MKHRSIIRRVVISVLFLTLFFGGYCLSLTPMIANAEGGGGDPPIFGDSSGSAPMAPSGDGPSVFWFIASSIMSNYL